MSHVSLGAGLTPGRSDGSAVLSRWQCLRATTERGLNTGCRGHPCKPTVGSALNQAHARYILKIQFKKRPSTNSAPARRVCTKAADTYHSGHTGYPGGGEMGLGFE